MPPGTLAEAGIDKNLAAAASRTAASASATAGQPRAGGRIAIVYLIVLGPFYSVLFRALSLLYFGCRRQSRHRSERWASHRQRAHIEDAAVASGRHAVTLRLVQMPATAASVSSEHGRISSKGSDAFRPRTPFISCSSLLRSDARMVDLYRVSTGVEQSSGDLHRAQVYVSSAVLGGAMVGARIAFGPHRK
jgi:hypothetical protein